MTPLPPPLGTGALVFWRLDQARHASAWNSGEGSFRVGGRWNSKGLRAVYAALDPATAILEVAVHTTFKALDTVKHVLTSARIVDAKHVHVVPGIDIPNPNWLNPGTLSAEQKWFGNTLLKTHPFVLFPSVVSKHSWNVVFDSNAVKGLYTDVTQENFALDPRLHPAT
jgi:RES domain-containing protein